MSKTSIFLLIAGIAGFASFHSLKATNCSQMPQVIEIHSISAIVLANMNTPAIDLSETPEFLKSISKWEAPIDPAKKKKFISALFSLPFPFGFVGAHRVMLGTGPWVPVVYVATLGGCFGLLPLIDFCFITFSKDITPFENNPHIFMWIKTIDKNMEDQ